MVKRFFLNNLGWKILSVIIALLLWLIVLNISDPVDTQTFYSVPVELANTNILTDDGKVFEVLDNAGTIAVRVSAKRSVLNSLTKDNIRAVADFSEVTLSNTVAIHLSATKSSSEIENITSPTEYLSLNIEDVQKKQLVIDMVTTGTPAEGYYVGVVTADQNLVRISGAKSVIDKIQAAEVVVDVSGMSENISTSTELRYYDSEGRQIRADGITANIERVDVNVAILTTKKLRIDYQLTGTPATGYDYAGDITLSPASIEVLGEKNVLDTISFIAIPEGVIDVDKAKETKEIEVDIRGYLPKNVYLFDEDHPIVNITIPIGKLLTRTFRVPKENIALINIPEGFTASLVDYESHNEVSMEGIAEEMEAISADSYFGSVDVAEHFAYAQADPAEGLYAISVEYIIPDRQSQVSAHVVVVELKQIENGDEDTEGDNPGDTDTDTEG